MISTENVLEHFRCCKCYSFLSAGPIYSGPDGAPVCGRCAPNPRDIPNRPLEAFLKKYTFPCKYREQGCTENVCFNEVGHEEHCQFKVSMKFPFEIFDNTVLREWKCYDCQNLLTVGPISLTPEGDSLCGRCSGRWSKMHVEEPLARNWKLEYLMGRLPLPCKYLKDGCKRALKWEEVEEHEDFCLHRPYSCPSMPFDSCSAVIPARKLFSHFEKDHAEFALTSPKFRQNLDKDSHTHRLVRVGNSLLVLMTKIRVHENRMWFCAAFVGDANVASKMQYNLNISNPEETLHMPFNTDPIQPDLVLHMNQETAIRVSIDDLKCNIKVKKMEVVCSLTITECAQSEPKWENLKHCKWSDCTALGIDASIKCHEDETCLERLVKCRWDWCDWKISFRNIAEHENTCDKELILCKFDNCKREYHRGEMQIHESKCDFRVVCCKLTNCNKQYQFNEMEQHESECDERTRNI